MANNNYQERKKLGALWQGTSKAGNPYVRGLVEIGDKTYNFVGFQNKNKNQAKSPDFFLYEDESRDDNKKPAQTQKTPVAAKKAAPKATPAPAAPEPTEDTPL